MRADVDGLHGAPFFSSHPQALLTGNAQCYSPAVVAGVDAVIGCCALLIASIAAAKAPDEAPAADDIIVTGERSKRTLRDTASSVVVVTGKQLESQPVDRVEDVLAFIPNVQLGHGSQGPAIRGLDTTGALQALPAFLGGNRPRTTLVVDGRPATYNEFVFGAAPVWDVDRLEVFRSPQTTTQGLNSIAGAIFVHTADPGFEPEYRVRAIAGNFRTRQISALASGPIGDELAARIAGDISYARTTARIADRAEGADPNHDVYGQLRAKMLFKPAGLPDSRVRLTYSHLRSQAPQVVQVSQPFRERRDLSGFYGTFRTRVDSLTASARHRFGDFTADLVLTGGESLVRRLAFPGLGQSRTQGRDRSAELIVNWSSGGPLAMLAGVSRRSVNLDQSIDLSAISGISTFRDRQLATGLFGEGTLKLTERARLTGGLRYQLDRQRRAGSFGTDRGPVPLDYDRSFGSWLPKVSLAYDFSDKVTGGVLIQKASNPGGTTLRFDQGLPDLFEAERLWDYEAFVRTRLAGGRLAANLNVFHYDIRDAQRAKEILVLAPNGRFIGFADLINVPRASVHGAEADVHFRASESLSARMGMGLLRTRILRSPAQYPEFEGQSFDRSPRLTAFGSVEWRPVRRLLLSAQARHHEAYQSEPVANPLTRVAPGTIVDARAEYGFGRFSVSAYARNIFDTFSIVSRNRFFATLEDPREAGIGFEARF